MIKISLTKHVVDYTISFYAALVASIAVLFMLKQPPINYGLSALIVIVVLWVIGYFGVVVLDFAISVARAMRSGGEIMNKEVKRLERAVVIVLLFVVGDWVSKYSNIAFGLQPPYNILVLFLMGIIAIAVVYRVLPE